MNDDITITELEAAPTTATEQLESGGEETLDSTPLRKFFYGGNSDLSDDEIKDLNIVWGYYSQGSNGPGETLGRVRDLERSLSTPPQGVSRLQHIASYVRILMDESDLEKQKTAYYG